jgi:acyl carrier protein
VNTVPVERLNPHRRSEETAVRREEILERIRAQLHEHLEVDPELVTEDALLVSDLDVDSLDLLELMVYLRQEFDIAVHEGEVKSLLTSLARFLPDVDAPQTDDLEREELASVTESLRVGTILDFVESRLTAGSRQ